MVGSSGATVDESAAGSAVVTSVSNITCVSDSIMRNMCLYHTFIMIILQSYIFLSVLNNPKKYNNSKLYLNKTISILAIDNTLFDAIMIFSILYSIIKANGNQLNKT